MADMFASFSRLSSFSPNRGAMALLGPSFPRPLSATPPLVGFSLGFRRFPEFLSLKSGIQRVVKKLTRDNLPQRDRHVSRRRSWPCAFFPKRRFVVPGSTLFLCPYTRFPDKNPSQLSTSPPATTSKTNPTGLALATPPNHFFKFIPLQPEFEQCPFRNAF